MHLQQSFNRRGTLSPNGPCASIVESTDQSCGQKIAGAFHGSNPQADTDGERGRLSVSFKYILAGKTELHQYCVQRIGVILTSTVNFIRWWEDYFEDLFKPTNMSCIEEAESVDSGAGWPKTGAEVAEIVKRFNGLSSPVMKSALSTSKLWMLCGCLY